MSPAVETFPVASARMYSWSPSLTAAWQRLLQWVSARAAVSLEVLNLSDPVSLDDLWAREDLGCVFMCGYPWALRADRPHLINAGCLEMWHSAGRSSPATAATSNCTRPTAAALGSI